MPILVTINLPNRTALIEAEKIDRDPHLDANVLLFGTKNLALPAPDETPFITTVWSVPKAMVQFYAVGHREPPAPPAPPPAPVQAEPPAFLADAGEALAADRARALDAVEEAAPVAKRKGGRKPRVVPVPATE